MYKTNRCMANNTDPNLKYYYFSFLSNGWLPSLGVATPPTDKSSSYTPEPSVIREKHCKSLVLPDNIEGKSSFPRLMIIINPASFFSETKYICVHLRVVVCVCIIFHVLASRAKSRIAIIMTPASALSPAVNRTIFVIYYWLETSDSLS